MSLAELRVTLREHRLKKGLISKRSAGSDIMATIKKSNKKDLEDMMNQYQIQIKDKNVRGRNATGTATSRDPELFRGQMEIGKHSGASFMEILSTDYQYAPFEMRREQH